MPIAVSTVRAGNVIGGGDFAMDRIIPDCIRAAIEGKNIIVRNSDSIRPYEHVLEPVVAYLMIAMMQYKDCQYSGSYNVGPGDEDCWKTGDLVELFCNEWNKKTGQSVKWVNQYNDGPHEAQFLKLDCSKIRSIFNWRPTWNVETTMKKIIDWTYAYINHDDHVLVMKEQIKEFCNIKDDN